MKLDAVICFLWFDPRSPRAGIYTYDESHVRRLQDQVMMTGGGFEHQWDFICVSDRPIDGVETIPLDFSTFVSGTRFAKLMMFAPEGPLAGKRFLYLDLDCVVTGPLLPLVDRSEDLVLWRNPNFGQPGRARYNTSIILHTGGTRTEFWTEFEGAKTLKTVQERTGWGGTDQAWISYRSRIDMMHPPSSDKHWDEAYWTDADGVYGAGRLKLPGSNPGGNLDGVGTVLPDNAHIVFFPGARTPWTPGIKDKHPWIDRFEVAA